MSIYDYNYTNLHCHCGQASLRDSLAKVDELAKRYVELGMKNFALTDHAQITGMFQLFKECKKHSLKPLLGCEIYVIDETDVIVGKKGEIRDHLIIYPISYEYMPKFFGIISEANRNKFNGFGRISYQKLFEMDLSGLIVSSACSIGFLKRPNYEEYALKFYKKLGDRFYLEVIPVSYNAKKIADQYQEILDKQDKTQQDIFFLESIPENCISLVEHTEIHKKTKQEIITNKICIDGGKLANQRAIELHNKHGIRLVACLDSHYVYKEDSVSHQVLLCQRSNTKMDSLSKWSFGEDNIYVKDIKEFRDAFVELGYIDNDIILKAILESNKIADMIDLHMPDYYVNLPTPFPNRNDRDVMNEFIKQGWEKYNIDSNPNKKEYIDRLNTELEVFYEFGLERYMLIMADIFDYIRKENIPHNVGRGSSAGSLVAYLMGITKINPLQYNLLFERFLNKGRINKTIIDGKICIDSNSLADIDSDVSKSLRYKIVDYIKNKYGHDKVCQISNYVYYTPKSAFKAVCSAYSIDFKIANALTDYIEEGTYKDENGNLIAYSELESLQQHPELIKFFKQYPDYYKHVLKLNSLVSSNSVHAAAIVIADKPIQDIAPIDIRNEGEVVCLNMKEASTMGLVKIDLLGLATTDVLFNTCEMIGMNPDDIPLQDEQTELMLSKGESGNVFQLDSYLARKTLKDIGKGDLQSLIHLNSLLRPGCLKAKDSDGLTTYEKYIKCARGEIQDEYIIPELKPILSSTHGLFLFQEQVLQTFTQLAGFTLQASDNVRRSLGKKNRELIDSYKQQFIDGCLKNNIPPEKSNEIFNIIVYSSGYIFNLSHSVSYSVLGFMTAYLKTHYATQYWCSTLTYANKKEFIPDYIKFIKLAGIQIKTPDINLSHATKYIIIEDYILAPLNSCKWVGDNISESIISIRTTPFIDINDFNNRINQLPKRPNKRCLASLYFSNAFKSLNHYEKDPKKASEKMLEYLPIFSPLPYIDLTQNIERDFNQIKSIANTIKQCANEEYIKPVGKPSNVLCILEVGKNETQLMEVNSWFKSELEKRLNYQICIISPSGCKDLCESKCVDKLELFIQSIKPLLILNCSSKTSKLFGYKFGETFGNINYVEKFDCHLINIPSPAYMGFKKDVKEIYRNKIIPLLENYKIKDNSNE